MASALLYIMRITLLILVLSPMGYRKVYQSTHYQVLVRSIRKLEGEFFVFLLLVFPFVEFLIYTVIFLMLVLPEDNFLEYNPETNRNKEE